MNKEPKFYNAALRGRHVVNDNVKLAAMSTAELCGRVVYVYWGPNGWDARPERDAKHGEYVGTVVPSDAAVKRRFDRLGLAEFVERHGMLPRSTNPDNTEFFQPPDTSGAILGIRDLLILRENEAAGVACLICAWPKYASDGHSSEYPDELCFDCAYWAQQYTTPGGLIIEGTHYRDGGKVSNRASFRGFGGRLFRYIKDGVVHETNNLWHQGPVPETFRDVMPDNAEWHRVKDPKTPSEAAYNLANGRLL